MLLSDDNAEDTRPIRLVMSDLQYQWYELPEHLGNKTSCLTFWRSPLIITLVLFILTLIPLLSMLTFHSLDMASLTITNNSGLNAEPLLPQNFCCYHDLFWRLFLHLCTSLPILAILQLPACALPSLPLLLEPYQKLSPNPQKTAESNKHTLCPPIQALICWFQM